MAPENPAKLTLVLGGARSGKSQYAEGLVTARPGPWLYIATAQSHDAEMTDRIASHKSRRGAGWTTQDAPLELAAAVGNVPVGQPVLIDCLTLWLSNVMLSETAVDPAIDGLVAAVSNCAGPCVVVSNEVGLGIVPDNALARAFRDHAGRLHQKLAVRADRVVLVVAGLAMVVK